MRAFHRKGLSVFLLLVALSYGSEARSETKAAFLPQDSCLPADGGPSVPVYFFSRGTNSKPTKVAFKVSLGRLGPLADLGNGLFSVEYHPPSLKKTRDVVFIEENSGVKRSYRVCPDPAGRITVYARPQHLLAGQGQKASVSIELKNSHGTPVENARLQVTTNIGSVHLTKESGPGRYEAEFVPPGDPFPQVAIVMVAWPDGARFGRVAVGRVVIPITARIVLPGKTAPGTRMKMTVAGRTFGPVSADSGGSFSLPILVPPGYDTGRASSVDRVGNRKTRRVNLYLPETNQLGIWAYPRQLVAGTVDACRILVTTIDKFGKPMDLRNRKTRDLKIEADRGKIHGLRRIARGLFEAYYLPPKTVGQGGDEVRVGFPGGGSKSYAKVELNLLPGPAARLELVLPELLAADGKSKGMVKARVFDELGNPASKQVMELYSSVGSFSKTIEESAGVFVSALIVEPDPASWKAEVRAVATNSRSAKAFRLEVSAGSLLRKKHGGFVLTAVLVDSFGLPVENQKVEFAVGELVLHSISSSQGLVEFPLPDIPGTGPHDGLLLASGGLIRKQVFWLSEHEGFRLLPIGLERFLPSSEPLVATDSITLHPPTKALLNVVVGDKLKGKPWREVHIRLSASDGRALAGRKIKTSSSIGKWGKLREASPGNYIVNWTPGNPGWSKAVLSVFDVESSVGAIVEVKE